MFFLKLVTMLTVILVVGCQNSPQKPSKTTTQLKIVTPPSNQSLAAKKENLNDLQSSMSPEILYLILTAETALQREHYAVALDAYLEVIKQVDDLKMIEKATKIALYIEDNAKTKQLVFSWLKKDPDNIIAKRIALTLALKAKDETEAVNQLTSILSTHPSDFDELLLDIQSLLGATTDIDFSERLFNRLEKEHPQQASIFLSQAIVALRQQKFKQAQQKTTEALALQPQWEKALRLDAELWLYSAKISFKNKKFSKAISAYKNVQYQKLKFKAAVGVISVLFAQEKLDKAHQELTQLLQQYPKKRTRILLMKVQIEDKQENYQEAFDLLTEMLKESPQTQEVLYSRSLIAEKLGDLKTLEGDLRKILQQDPKNVAALNALGYTLVDKTTRYAEAEKYLKRALALEPEAAVIIDSYGWLKFKQGDLQTALKYLQQARNKMTGENEIVAHLAEVLWELNKKMEARQLIDEEMSKKPQDKYLLEFKQRVLDKAI